MEAPNTVAPTRSQASARRNRDRPLTYRELRRLAALLDRCVRCRQVDLVTPSSTNPEFGAGCGGDGMRFTPVVHDGDRHGTALEIGMPTVVVKRLAATLE